jgi:hypothetical protein
MIIWTLFMFGREGNHHHQLLPVQLVGGQEMRRQRRSARRVQEAVLGEPADPQEQHLRREGLVQKDRSVR